MQYGKETITEKQEVVGHMSLMGGGRERDNEMPRKIV